MNNQEQTVITLCGTLKGHAGWVTSIACPAVADSNIVVSASRDKTLMIWELTRSMESYGVAKKSLRGHNHFIQDLTLSADGQYALTASWDKTLRLWDLNECKTSASFVGHTHDVMSVSLSADNRQIVSGSRDKSIKLWNIKGDCKVNMPNAHAEWVSCTRFSPNAANPLMVSCGWDKTVKVWDMTRQSIAVEHLGHGGYINTTQVSPDGSLCATGGKDGRVMLWDLSQHQALFQLEAGDEIHALAFSPSRYWLAAATTSGIKIWDLENRRLVDDLRFEPSQKTKTPVACVSLCWSSDGATLFSGYTDNLIRVWQVSIA